MRQALEHEDDDVFDRYEPTGCMRLLFVLALVAALTYAVLSTR